MGTPALREPAALRNTPACTSRPACSEQLLAFTNSPPFLLERERMTLGTDCASICPTGCLHALCLHGCVDLHSGVRGTHVCVCAGHGPFEPEREPSSFLRGASRGSRRRAVGSHSPARADYSPLRKMRFLSHRASVIKIKYNVWLGSAKCTSTGAFQLNSKAGQEE